VTAKTSDIDYALTAKGFLIQDCKHHRMYWLYDGSKKTSIRTRMSKGAHEIDSYLIGRMAKDVRLRKDEFLALVKCTLSGIAYMEKMKAEGQVVGSA